MTEDLDRINILLVDDRPENLLALETLLESPDRRLVKATSGNEALGCLLDDDFALVLLDVQMPEMDGFEVADLMRGNERTRHIPIIFVTAISKEEQHISRGYAAGAVDYLFKPIDPRILISKVNVFLELYRQKQLLRKTNQQLQLMVESLKTANQRILEQQRAVIEEERLKLLLEMAGASANELNQPLMSLLGSIELLRLVQQDPNKLEEHLQRIETSAERMAGIIRRIQAVQQHNTCVHVSGPSIINPDQAIHILVVDPSDQDFQRLVQLLTDYASIRLCRATTLQAAIPEVMQGDHDVILLEHLLPDGTGVELIQQMNEQGIVIPVMMVTGQGDEMIASRVIQAGAYDYIPKELLTTPSLVEAITRVLDKARLKKESRIALEKMAEMTIKDELTGLYNRRYFFEALGREMARAKRYKTEMVLAMVDLDHFKPVNDTLGHPVGDLVLKKFGRLLRDCLRKSDVCCRYGGEEFALILPAISLEEAVATCERLRSIVAEHAFVYADGSLHITISIGISAYIPATHSSRHALVAEADQALYQAKSEGRNRVQVYLQQV